MIEDTAGARWKWDEYSARTLTHPRIIQFKPNDDLLDKEPYQTHRNELNGSNVQYRCSLRTLVDN